MTKSLKLYEEKQGSFTIIMKKIRRLETDFMTLQNLFKFNVRKLSTI